MIKFKSIDVGEWLLSCGDMIVNHFNEVMPDEKLKLNIDVMNKLYNHKRLFIIVALEDDIPIGYSLNMLIDDFTISEVQNKNWGIYLKPENRKGWTATKLIRLTEKTAKEMGAQRNIFGMPVNSVAESLLKTKRLGYSCLETNFSKQM